MELFERAHVTHKDSSKMKKSEGAIKKQLKQMLHAYKSGNNHEIKSFADREHSYDLDDVKSMSEISEISFHKEVETSQESVSSRINTEFQSNSGDSSNSTNDHSSSNSNVTPPQSGSLNTKFEYEEGESRSLQSSQDTTDKGFSSMFYSSAFSEEYSDSDISIPSSLQTFSDDSNVSENEEFDPDGALANKILEKLGRNVKQSNERKLVKENIKNPNREKKKQEKETLPMKEAEKESKTLNKTLTNTKTNVFKVIQTRNENNLTYRNVKAETSDDLSNSEFKDSLSDKSSPFISVTASDMQSQSLSDIIGDYIHPTVRNLPSVYYESNKYTISDEVTNDDNVEDISSIIPEIGEDLAIEDLSLEQEPLLEPDEDTPMDESTPYDDTVQTEDYFEQDSSTENIEPNTVSMKVYSSKNYYILTMKHPIELFVHGKVKVTAIGGSVEVFGYTVQDETIDLYAPYCNIAHSIKTNGASNAFHGLFSRLSSVGLTASESEEIITNVTGQDAVVGLSKLNCPKMDFVDNNFSMTELFSKRVDKTPMFLKKTAENLGCSLYIDRPKKVLEEKSSWEQVVACGMSSQSRGIICGGKGTGKSTLLRYYVNRLLSSGPVLVIDLDPGQAEFTMPGNVSVQVVSHPLIGPNFTHLRQPEKMLNIGMINIMENISRYISAVTELITYCQSTKSYHNLPWIVNTMGMCNQMGLKIITRIILEIQPTFVFQIDSKIAKKRFEFELQSETVRNFYEECMQQKLFRTEKDPYNLDYTFILGVNENAMSPQKGNGFSLLPRDERYLNVLAYFGQLLDIYGKSILEIVPYEVDIRNLNFGANVKIPEQAVMKVINGKIIALCQLAATDKGKMFTLNDKAILCHGYGLIRGIDLEKELLYIITPVHITDLELINTIVYADWMPELIEQEKDLPRGTIVPYRTATVFHERMLMFPPRRRFNPYQLLKATRSA